MMEESEKRRERLKAMRNDAAQSGVSNNNLEGSGFASPGLSNPLIEQENTSTPAPRFDFYTDPMSAFSANKRKNSNSPQVSPMLYNAPPRPSYLEGTPPPAYHHPSINFPGLSYLEGTPPPAYHHPSVSLPGQRVFQAARAQFNHGPLQNPMEIANPRGMTQGIPPRAWGGSNYNNPPNFSRGGSNFMGPGNVQGGYTYVDYGRGRGQTYNSGSSYGSGPHSNYGRGRGRSLNTGTSGGRVRGSNSRDPVSAEMRPDLYYKKEMIEDPWKMLNPVPWKSLADQDSEKKWLPASISVKKAKTSLGEASRLSVSQPSLAEILASSLHGPGSETVDSEQGT